MKFTVAKPASDADHQWGWRKAIYTDPTRQLAAPHPHLPGASSSESPVPQENTSTGQPRRNRKSMKTPCARTSVWPSVDSNLSPGQRKICTLYLHLCLSVNYLGLGYSEVVDLKIIHDTWARAFPFSCHLDFLTIPCHSKSAP